MSAPITPSVDIASSIHAASIVCRKRFAGKHIAMVTYSPYPFDPRPRRAVDALAEEGASIDLICLGGNDAPRREVVKGINVLRIPLEHRRRGKFGYAYRYGAFIFISSVIFAIRSLARRYDLVYVHNMPDILVVSSLIPRALGARVVLDLHDPMPELMMTIFRAAQDSSSVQLMKRLEKWSIERTDLVITVSLAFKQIFSSRSCPPEKIAVVMNAPDGRIFPLRPPQLDTINRAGNKPFVIMYHGSIVERNGLDVAVEALARVRRAISTVELRIYGTATPFLEHIMEAVRTKGLQESVRYLGPRSLEALVPEIEACDLGVIPNQRNAFTEINTPTRIFEYLALGKTVIAPSTRGITDYFDKGTLLFFRSGDAEDLAQQIEYAFSHPREAFETAQRGQRVYLEHTWAREKQTLVDRIGGILGRPETKLPK